MDERILNVHGLNVGDTEFDELTKAKANEIDSRPPYMYTSLCPDSRFRAPALTIYSRRVRIPHASHEGGWLHTDFFVGCDGTDEEKKFMSLEDAKEYAETVGEQNE